MRDFALVALAMLLVGCGSSGDTRVASAPPPGCAPVNDRLIVPGCRIGPATLGMTEAEVLRFLGPPDRSQGYTKQANAVDHEYQRLHILVEMLDGRVRRVRSYEKATFATREGIRAGSTELELKVKMGEPAWRRLQVDRWTYCYQDKTSVYLGGGPAKDSGKVRGFAINACNPGE